MDIKKIENILFDLDGTVVDSGSGVINAVMYALGKFGINVGDASELYGFMGPPLSESFPKFYNFSPEKTEEAIGFYREYYTDKGLFEFEVYQGIESVFEILRNSGKNIFIATTKPEIFAKDILSKCSLDKYINFIGGSTLDGTMEDKADVIKYVLDTNGIDDGANCLMVGDRMYDIIGAAKNNIKSVGVLYGYGSRDELEGAGASYIAETVSDLNDLLI